MSNANPLPRAISALAAIAILIAFVLALIVVFVAAVLSLKRGTILSHEQ